MRNCLKVLLVASLVIGILSITISTPVSAKKPASPPGQDKKGGDGGSTEYDTTIVLYDIDSGLTSPTGVYRWLDVANQAYSTSYRDSYDYTQAEVSVAFSSQDTSLKGLLTARNLKPNFAYQVKLSGDTVEYPEANENIGFVGRWWREQWNGSEWTSGSNSNDSDYLVKKDIEDLSSPTGKSFKFTGYLVFDYLITDSKGNAYLEFEANSSYHVLWKTTQRIPTANDGKVKSAKFKVNEKTASAYDTSYGWVTVGIYGEVERIPVGGKYLSTGTYDCQLFLTEESFHGSGGTYSGNWAAAMGAPITFEITE